MNKNFYHFTCRPNLDSILSQGFINLGKIPNEPGKNEIVQAVCLTTDPSPDGHGLPDGREISELESSFFSAFYKNSISGKLYSVDHTKFRIEISLNLNDVNLVKFDSYHGEELVQAAEVTAYFPTTHTKLIRDNEWAKVDSMLNEQPAKRKSATWWYYLAPIPVAKIQAISFRSNTDRTSYLRTPSVEYLQSLLHKEIMTRPKV